ncbi:MAG: hypothetical protein JW909_09820 [Planctomycetes bacterium]|nr:hypothetical protein [Planctomycetota bacterium]
MAEKAPEKLPAPETGGQTEVVHAKVVAREATADTGHLQIKCKPGVLIFLDGNLLGPTKAEYGGMIIQDIAKGRHELKAVMEGFMPVVDTITIPSGGVLVHSITSFVPALVITQEGDDKDLATAVAQTGDLVIQSLPVECTIDIPAAGVAGYRKEKDKWKARNIPGGEYRATFSAMGKRLTHDVKVTTGKVTVLMVNFVDGTVSESVEDAAGAGN